MNKKKRMRLGLDYQGWAIFSKYHLVIIGNQLIYRTKSEAMISAGFVDEGDMPKNYKIVRVQFVEVK